VKDAGAKPEDLAGNGFLKAIGALEQRPRPLGDGRAPASAQASAADWTPRLGRGGEGAVTGRYRIRAPASAWMDEEIELSLVPMDAGAPAPKAIRWIFAGRQYSGGPSFRLPRASTPGTYSVQAVVDDSDNQSHIAFATIEVMRRWSQDASAQAEDRARRTAYIQTGFSAALTSVFGFAILAPAFLGTWEQMVAAFAWGFATDLGLAKALELANPAKAAHLRVAPQ
jgi:hypothetical protein